MLKPWHQKFCTITKKGSIYSFHNFRDFHRNTNNEDIQKPHRTEEQVDLKKILWVYMYICPFAFYDMVGHTIMEFVFEDKKSVCLTVEGEQYIGKEYSFWTALYPGYRIRYIWWSQKDVIGLRTQRRGDRLIKYPLHIEKKILQKLFSDLVEETNYSKNHNLPYGLIANNCTSSIWNIARKSLPIPKTHRSLIFNKFLPAFLHRLGIIKLREKEIIRRK